MFRVASCLLCSLLIAGVFLLRGPGVDYPKALAKAPKDSLLDSWQMENRECTSYAAYKIWETYYYSVKGWGDAHNWIMEAAIHRLPIGTTPRLHTVAVDTTYTPGHVMWVEKVYPDGYIKVSQYNADNDGGYSEQTFFPEGLYFIYF